MRETPTRLFPVCTGKHCAEHRAEVEADDPDQEDE